MTKVNLLLTVVSLYLILLLSACTSSKNLNYFNDLPEQTVVNLPPIQTEERVIEKGDDLYIHFSAKDNDAAAFFNKGGATISTGITTGLVVPTTTNTGNSVNYIVDNDGFLQFPVLGLVKVTGLTINQLRTTLLKNVAPYLKEPIIDIQFNTFRVTFLGEVGSKGTRTLPLQRTTIFEALGAAGDLTQNARRDDIQLYRDYNGQRKIIRIDLRKADVLNNEQVFQMRHNDVLYVKTRKGVLTQNNTNAVTATLSIVLSLITIGITLLRK